MASRDERKRNAAEAALAYVKPGMVLGLGTGSTARHFLAGVARLVADGMDLKGVPTSLETAEEAKRLGIPLTSLEESFWLDLTVDGADEDDPKLDRRLGTKTPLPVEVHPFGWKNASAALEGLGAKVELRKEGSEPFRTDNGNHILDAHFGPIRGPGKLAARISGIPGVVGHGLFLKMAHAVVVASQMGVRTLELTRMS